MIDFMKTIISAIKIYVDKVASKKADIGHTHDDRYCLKSEINGGSIDSEFISVDDIDAICGSSIEYVNMSEGAF